MKLTIKSTTALELPAGKAERIEWDDDLPGFGIRLREGGSRNWVFQYKLGKKQRRMSLGSAKENGLPLVKAREIASELHAKVRLGHDPAGEKEQRKAKAAETFEAVAQIYLAARKREMRPGAYDQIERHLLKYAKSLHGLQLANIDQRTTATTISQIRDRSGNVQGNRARSSLQRFYGWAMEQGIVTHNPVINTGKFPERSRERTLTDDELRVIWNEAGDDQYGSIVKLLMLTGQRADEMASLRRLEVGTAEVPKTRVDGIERTAFTIDAIELPAERTKNKRPHIVPLSKPALAILERQPRRVSADGKLRDLVFGAGEGGFSGWSQCKGRLDGRVLKGLREIADERGDQKLLAYVAKVEDLIARIAKAKGAERKALSKQLNAIWWVHHDLRRTMDTVMNDRLGIAPHVVEAILNHVSSHKSGKSGVAGVYNKALYLRERTEALRLWADHIMALFGGNVVPLRRGTAP
jgi:integrase